MPSRSQAGSLNSNIHDFRSQYAGISEAERRCSHTQGNYSAGRTDTLPIHSNIVKYTARGDTSEAPRPSKGRSLTRCGKVVSREICKTSSEASLFSLPLYVQNGHYDYHGKPDRTDHLTPWFSGFAFEKIALHLTPSICDSEL